MQVTLKTRKPVDKLTVGDLVAFPIWEFASDEEDVEGQDETWVRPVGRKQVPAGAYSQLVASDFTTASGVKLQGFMTVTTANKIEVSAGALVAEGFYCVLPNVSEGVASVRLCDGFLPRLLGSAPTKRSGDSNEIESFILVGY